MVDAVGSVAKIVGVALKIKEAVNMVHQNKKDCHHIKSRVDILNKALSHHENNTDLMEDPAVMAALEALHGILSEALELITKCQEEENILCIYCTAGKLSRQLSKLELRISHLSSDAMLTITSYVLLMKFQEGAPHPPPQIPEVGNSGRDAVASMTWRSCGSRLRYWCAARPTGVMVGERGSLVERIVEVAEDIEEEVEMVLQNRDDCVEIVKRVNKVNTLLSQLEDTKMADAPGMRGALENLLVTFRRAHTLVISCQRGGLVIVFLCSTPGRLSKQLHEVMDEMASNIDDMAAIVLT